MFTTRNFWANNTCRVIWMKKLEMCRLHTRAFTFVLGCWSALGTRKREKVHTHSSCTKEKAASDEKYEKQTNFCAQPNLLTLILNHSARPIHYLRPMHVHSTDVSSFRGRFLIFLKTHLIKKKIKNPAS